MNTEIQFPNYAMSLNVIICHVLADTSTTAEGILMFRIFIVEFMSNILGFPNVLSSLKLARPLYSGLHYINNILLIFSISQLIFVLTRSSLTSSNHSIFGLPPWPIRSRFAICNSLQITFFTCHQP